MKIPAITLERQKFHSALKERLLVMVATGKDGKNLVATNADASNSTSSRVANAIAGKIGAKQGERISPQTAGDEFESAVSDFVSACFAKLQNLRPGNWAVKSLGTRTSIALSEFEQYRHLGALADLSRKVPQLAIALGNDYQISPDVIVVRKQEPDSVINKHETIVGAGTAQAAALRLKGNSADLLHASISCKWTIRSDRAQNARSEALNLIRNRKGRTPHIAVVTGEPLPSRLSSLALGTGDIDCVYHFALYELIEAVSALKQSEPNDMLKNMIEGGRLKDISDLPLDLAV